MQILQILKAAIHPIQSTHKNRRTIRDESEQHGLRKIANQAKDRSVATR
jgi:hypothetical protein